MRTPLSKSAIALETNSLCRYKEVKILVVIEYIDHSSLNLLLNDKCSMIQAIKAAIASAKILTTRYRATTINRDRD